METHKRRTSKLSLEPNPFERSFSLAHADESQSGRSSVGNANSSKPITLPPVTAINSPLGHEGVSAAWGRDSLRSGPLSPAMLGGPAAQTSRARITPRLGLTDPTLHTGLTPFLQGETHPTVSSILGTSTIDGSKPSPGLQALLRAVSGSEITATPGGSLHVKPLQNVSASVTATALQKSPRPMIAAAGRNLQSASQTQVNVTSATSPATFKHDVISIKPPSPPAISLSTIPEPQPSVPQPRAAAGNLLPPPPGLVPIAANVPMELSSKNIATAKPAASSKRRPIDPTLQSAAAPAAAAGAEDSSEPSAAASAPKAPPKTAKRSRGKGAKAPVPPKGLAAKESAARAPDDSGDGARKASRRSESVDPKGGEDEKRKQFLERNRIAALKCRQRKKQQLNELQQRHDYMVYENERLKNEYLQLRDKALHIKTLLEAHRECAVAQANGVFGIDSLPPGTPNISSQPIVFALPDGVQSEKLKEIISAIPPTSNGVPISGVDAVAGKPFMMPVQPGHHQQQQQHSVPPPPGAMMQGIQAPLVAQHGPPGFRPPMGSMPPQMMPPPPPPPSQPTAAAMSGMVGQAPPLQGMGRPIPQPQQRVLHFTHQSQAQQAVANAPPPAPLPSSST